MPAILSALFSRSSQPNRAHTLGGRPTAPITTPSGPGALWHGVGGEGARVAGFGPWPDKLKRLLRRRANVGTSARSWVRSGGSVCGLAAGGASMPHRFPALIAAPAPGAGRLCLTGLRLLDGTGGPVREGVAVLVEDGVIRRVTTAQEPCPAGADAEAEPAAEITPMLADLARRNIEEGAASLQAARDAGVKIALGSDVSLGTGAEIQRMIRHGLSPAEALTAAAGTAAQALGLADHIGTVAEGKFADLLIVDGDPLAEPWLLSDASRIWLVLQLGVPVAGRALERDVGVQPGEPLINK